MKTYRELFEFLKTFNGDELDQKITVYDQDLYDFEINGFTTGSELGLNDDNQIYLLTDR